MVIHNSNVMNFFESGVFIFFFILTLISLTTPFWQSIRAALSRKKDEQRI